MKRMLTVVLAVGLLFASTAFAAPKAKSAPAPKSKCEVIQKNSVFTLELCDVKPTADGFSYVGKIDTSRHPDSSFPLSLTVIEYNYNCSTNVVANKTTGYDRYDTKSILTVETGKDTTDVQNLDKTLPLYKMITTYCKQNVI